MESINLVDAAEIIDEFHEAGVEIPDEKVVEKLKMLCCSHNLTPADLYAQWLCYTNKNPGNTDTLDFNTAEEIEARIFQSRIKSVKHDAIKAKFVPKVKPQINLDILETYVSLGNVKKEPIDDDYKINDSYNDSYIEQKVMPIKIKSEPVDNYEVEPMEQVEIAGSSDNCQDLEPFTAKKIKIERVEDTDQEMAVEPYKEIKVDPDDHLFQKEVLCEFGRVIPSKAWISLKKERSLKIEPFDETRHCRTEDKFFDCNIRRSNVVMDGIFLDAYKEGVKLLKADEVAEFRNENITNHGELHFFGRIRLDILDEFDDKQVFLHRTCSHKAYQLDLSRVKNFSLFPGQIVQVLGEEATKTSVRVSEILDTSFLLKPFPSLPNLSQPINIVTASGPFHLPNSDDWTPLTNLLDYCVLHRPEVVILFGPILEMTPSMFDLFSFSLFNDAINMISEKLTDGKVIIISSPKEWHTTPVFPTPPYNGYWDNIEFYPSPSVIDINGLIIGASSVDITRHLNKNLFESRSVSESGNRIKRVLRHILVQNSFYPLYPSDEDVTLEAPRLEYCRFTKTPHIIILPSVIRNFIHSIEGCIFVNPEKVRKNTIGRIQVFPSQPNKVIVSKDCTTRIGSIESSISAQVIKI